MRKGHSKQKVSTAQTYTSDMSMLRVPMEIFIPCDSQSGETLHEDTTTTSSDGFYCASRWSRWTEGKPGSSEISPPKQPPRRQAVKGNVSNKTDSSPRLPRRSLPPIPSIDIESNSARCVYSVPSSRRLQRRRARSSPSASFMASPRNSASSRMSRIVEHTHKQTRPAGPRRNTVMPKAA